MDCANFDFELNSGRFMPVIGFGTYLIQGDELIFKVLDHALAAGYRQIDTATAYQNETSIGKALKLLLPKYNLRRENIFITSKVVPTEKAFEAVRASLRKLDCGYLDLYLIHCPGDNSKLRKISWASLVIAVQSGLVRDIGVSNYEVGHLKELLKNDFGIKPTVNQVLWHPKSNQPELLEFCWKENVILQAYSSLGGTGNTELLQDPTVKFIASVLGVSPAQVLLRWAVQLRIGIIPKARSERRIRENINLSFQIPRNLMLYLNNMNARE